MTIRSLMLIICCLAPSLGNAKVDASDERLIERSQPMVEWRLERSASPGDSLIGSIQLAQPVGYDAIELNAQGGQLSELSRELDASGLVVSIAFVYTIQSDINSDGMVSLAIGLGERRKPMLSARRVEILGVERRNRIRGDLVLVPISNRLNN